MWWSYQYGRHWLHLCIADALSSPSFQISGFTRQRFGSHAEGKQTPDKKAVNEILLFKFLQHARHDVKRKPKIVGEWVNLLLKQ